MAENLEVEVGKEEGEKEHKRFVSEYERGYHVGWNKGYAAAFRKMGVRPSEVSSGAVKIEFDKGQKGEVKEEGGKKESSVPLIVGIAIVVALGLVVLYFFTRERNKPSNY